MKMNLFSIGRRSTRASVAAALGLLAALGSAHCGSASDPNGTDPKFAPETYDEKEPLTNAIVGSPQGVIQIAADGTVTALPGPTGKSGGGSSGTVSGGSSGSTSSASASSASGGGPSDAGIVFPEDSAVAEDGGSGGGFGFWTFDDCSPKSHFLLDSSGEGATAQHALRADCVPGITGLGIQFRSAADVVQVPDEPQFTVSSRVAVAAWVFPDTVSGDQPIVLKRLNNQTSFSLAVHDGNIQFSVVLTTGTTVVSSAPLPAKTWSHVAGMFDGTFVRLFFDGQQFGQVYGAGTLRDEFTPIRIGATTQQQYFHGIIDQVFVSTEDITPDTLTALACIQNPSTLAVSPATSGPVPFDTTVQYSVAVTDNDVGFCASQNLYNFFFSSFDPTISESFNSSTFQSASPGQTVTFEVGLTSSDLASIGNHEITFVVEDFGNNFENLFGQLTYDVAKPTGCFVDVGEELFIMDTSVVDDPVRTLGQNSGEGLTGDGGIDSGIGITTGIGVGIGTSPIGSTGVASAVATETDLGVETDVVVAISPGIPPRSTGSSGAAGGTTSSGGSSAASSAPPPAPVDGGDDGGAPASSTGVWTFGHLMRDVAPTEADAPAMVEQLFDTWLTPQVVNTFTVAARPAIQSVLLDIWPRTADGGLDLDQAPLTLQAIVNRIDLRKLSAGSAGEGRFVFAVNGFDGFPQQFTVILEYNLPATTQQDVLNWANLWHSLSSLPFPSETYNSALEAITRNFAGRNALPGAVNGSALLTLRTNEIALSGIQWELREFVLSPATGFLQEAPVDETPDLSFNGTSTFADFVNQNSAAIIAEVPGATGTVPLDFEGGPFLGGSVFNNLVVWSAPAIVDDDARFHASLNTCNGCHGPETNTGFLMVNPRSPGTEATLSQFMTGTVVIDEITGEQRSLNDLDRRRLDLTSLVCPSDGGVSPSDAGLPPPPDAASPPDAGFAPSADAGDPPGAPAPVGLIR
jgi:hypothetical protein